MLEVIIKEKVSKLKVALQDISTLETASTTASLRLSEVRRSRVSYTNNSRGKKKITKTTITTTKKQTKTNKQTNKQNKTLLIVLTLH